MDISVELKDWLFALESAQEMADRVYLHDSEVSEREERSWHMTFQNIHINAKGTPVHAAAGKTKTTGKQKYPIELITVRTDFLSLFCISVFASIMSKSVCFFSLTVSIARDTEISVFSPKMLLAPRDIHCGNVLFSICFCQFPLITIF